MLSLYDELVDDSNSFNKCCDRLPSDIVGRGFTYKDVDKALCTTAWMRGGRAKQDARAEEQNSVYPRIFLTQLSPSNIVA